MTVPARVRAVVTSLAACLLAAACSSTDAAEPADTTTSTVIVTPPTSDTTTTATVATTSSTVSPLDDDAAVRAVHTRFMTAPIDERTNGPEATLAIAEELTTGPLLARLREGVQRSLDTGERLVGPGYKSNIIDVLIDGDTASVLDCSLDTAVIYGADGQVIVSASTEYKVRETRLIKVDGRWLIEDFVGGGAQPCEPGA